MRKLSYCLMACLICFNLAGAKAYAAELLASQSGFPGQQAHYGLLLTNSDTKAHRYDLQAQDLPKGFEQVFFQEQQVVKHISINPGQTAELELQLTIPSTSTAGNHQFIVNLIRDDQLKSAIPFNIKIDNSYLLKIVSSNLNLTALSGKSISFPVNISNSGQKELTGIKLNLELPHKWQVSVTQAKLASLQAGASANFQVKVTIPPTQDAGNQKITVVATADQVSTDALTIPVITEKSSSYLIIPITAVVIMLMGALIYIRKQGRR